MSNAFVLQGEYWGDHNRYRGDDEDEIAKEAYTAMLRVALYLPSGSQWDGFTSQVSDRSLDKYDFDFGDEKVKMMELITY